MRARLSSAAARPDKGLRKTAASGMSCFALSSSRSSESMSQVFSNTTSANATPALVWPRSRMNHALTRSPIFDGRITLSDDDANTAASAR